MDARANQSYKAVNNLLNQGIDVYRITDVTDGSGYSNGSFFIPPNTKAKTIIDKTANENNVQFLPVSKKSSSLTLIKKARIALWDVYGGSMPSGWTRWILEQFNYSFDVVYAKDIDTGNLRSKYDVIVFVGGAIPSLSSQTNENAAREGNMPNADSIPAEYRNRLGRITAAKSIPQLKIFLEEGGNIVTVGSSTALAYHLKLPVTNAMVEIVNGEEKPINRDKFYTPGSILKVSVNNNLISAAGMNNEADVYFDNSPVFHISPDGIAKGIVKPIAWFSNDKPLRSGWSWGQAYLKNGVAAFEATAGKGKLFAFGPEITFRAQAYGTFKLLFNQLYSY